VKQGLTARITLAIVFAGLVLSPLFVKRYAARQETSKKELDAQTALARHGFYLQEVSRAAGVNFVHQAPTLDARLAHIMPQVASMGASVSIVDFDHDGWPDIYVTTSKEGAKNALYRNMHDGTFKDVAEDLGIADVNQAGTGVSMAAVWGDYDNDGFEDFVAH
jgi:enediyne biosynthesis protein E4